ncbi:MAG: 30S ribosomal protein S7 [Candidatus Organicella extenuata]|uniref:Small ribosomal subunit protein uS7 n=1 Tax=Candidatus Organicella extenuata TaxID=2841811 RepID=A0AA51GEF7_9BACT|nr:MAG: 30S ribosomal protein S7 [Candidatus Organicella extenuata]
MSRRKKNIKKKLFFDIKYGSSEIEYLINLVMKNGKKSLARRIVYNSLDSVSATLNTTQLLVLEQVLQNTKPNLEVKSKRVVGNTYQVPVEISLKRQLTLAFKWLIFYARKRKKGMVPSLTEELLAAYNNTGSVVKKKEEVYKVAQANKAFSHLK